MTNVKKFLIHFGLPAIAVVFLSTRDVSASPVIGIEDVHDAMQIIGGAEYDYAKNRIISEATDSSAIPLKVNDRGIGQITGNPSERSVLLLAPLTLTPIVTRAAKATVAVGGVLLKGLSVVGAVLATKLLFLKALIIKLMLSVVKIAGIVGFPFAAVITLATLSMFAFVTCMWNQVQSKPCFSPFNANQLDFLYCIPPILGPNIKCDNENNFLSYFPRLGFPFSYFGRRMQETDKQPLQLLFDQLLDGDVDGSEIFDNILRIREIEQNEEVSEAEKLQKTLRALDLSIGKFVNSLGNPYYSAPIFEKAWAAAIPENTVDQHHGEVTMLDGMSAESSDFSFADSAPLAVPDIVSQLRDIATSVASVNSEFIRFRQMPNTSWMPLYSYLRLPEIPAVLNIAELEPSDLQEVIRNGSTEHLESVTNEALRTIKSLLE